MISIIEIIGKIIMIYKMKICADIFGGKEKGALYRGNFTDLILVSVITVIFTLFQIWLSRKEIPWTGLILPIIYWMVAAPHIKGFLSTGIKLIPDYYQAATFFFPGVWFVMIFFIFYYYNK